MWVCCVRMVVSAAQSLVFHANCSKWGILLHLNWSHLCYLPIQGKRLSSAEKHLRYDCKWESESGRREDGSNGQAHPSPPRRFIKRPSASVVVCLRWKARADQMANLLLKSTDKQCGQSRRLNKTSEATSEANWGCCSVLKPFKGKWNTSMSTAKRWPFWR